MTGQSRGAYRNGIETRRQLVENATRVFGEHGFRGGSLRLIAASVGASASQIISHFGSKDGLLTAVLDYWDVQQVDEHSVHGLAYVETLRVRMAYSHDNPAWAAFLLTLASEATAADHPAHGYFTERYARIADRLQAEILAAAESGEISPMDSGTARSEARGLSAMMDGLQLQWLLDRDIDLVADFDAYLDAVLQRWSAPPTSSPSHDH